MGEKNNKMKNLITAAALGQLALVVLFSIFGAYRHILTGRQSDIMIAASLFIFWVLMDVVEPVALHRFDGITQRQKSAYLKFAAFDFAGLAGIAYFLFCMGGPGNNGILGAVAYAVSIKLKRENQDIFYGLAPEEDETDGAPDGTEALTEEADGAPDGTEVLTDEAEE